jgi:hypothetical protein
VEGQGQRILLFIIRDLLSPHPSPLLKERVKVRFGDVFIIKVFLPFKLNVTSSPEGILIALLHPLRLMSMVES